MTLLCKETYSRERRMETFQKWCFSQSVTHGYLDMLHDSGELHWLVLALHGSWVKSITAILELDNVAFRVSYRQVILGAEVLQ